LNVPALLSPDDERLLKHVAQLASQGAAGVPALLQLFQQRSWTVRRAVVTALEHQDAAGLSILARALKDERSHEPTVAGIVDALSGASGAAAPLVNELLLSAKPAVLCDAIQIAGRRRERECVSRLIELTQHVDDNVVLAAVEGLGRLGGAEAVDRLIELAEGDNFFRAFPAIEVLGSTREARALPILQKLLQSPLYAQEAARAVGRIGSLSAVAPLVQASASAPEALIRVIASSLTAIQDAVEQSLGSGLAVSRAVREHAAPSLRGKVTRALAHAQGAEAAALGRLLLWLADDESVTDFVGLLGHGEEMTRLAIEGLKQLSALEDPRVLGVLETGGSELRAQLLPALSGLAAADSAITACLDDPQSSVRTLACHALARSNATHAVPRLFQLLTDADLGVVHAAVAAIQSLGSAETERLALAAARSQNPAERRAGLRIVLYLGLSSSLELAREALASNDERLRDVALAGVTALDEPEVTELLLTAARHDSGRTRASAVRALGHVTLDPRVAEALHSAHHDSDPWVRYYACQSQGRLRVAEAVPELIESLSDSAPQVRMAAVEALAAVPGEAAGRALVEAARSVNHDLRRAALLGIGSRKDVALRPSLTAALESSDPALRLVATSGIAELPGAENELEKLAATDPDAGVRHAAIELLASRQDEPSTSALIRVLHRDPSAKAVYAALARHLASRLPTLQAALAQAGDVVARALVSVLAHDGSRAARAALDAAFESSNVAARRAAARALSVALDDSARASLARGANLDPDPEVRRICAAAMA
jgi:HEAT repeat protein